ncbi:unnamed protein product [Adineta ricciae]|uniref:Uncharacterized protein n=1 Tax=Adineta ricciae TaxID=249248 RepID=A0A816ANZ3_ADIRI|nr:unnamed protein product [Adineta ricciae]CAF1598858.1 unnamed protein product [Adineta ricciae]
MSSLNKSTDSKEETASSITIQAQSTTSTQTESSPQPCRRFCIVLTNNPRMIRSASRTLHNATVNVSNQKVQERQRSPPPSPSKSQHREQLTLSNEQQVPLSTQFSAMSITTDNDGDHEKEIEDDFRAQIQSILQAYLQRTRRASSINSIFDMSNCVDN